MPGKSNAFEISRKLGLPENLIDAAKQLLSSEDLRFEDVIADAEYHRQVAEKERKLAEEAGRETVRLRDEAEKLRREMEEKRETSLRKAREDARRILEQARRESDAIIGDLKRIKKENRSADAEVNALRKRMEQDIDSLTEGLKQEVDTGEAPKQVKPGDRVRILTIGSEGVVLAPADARGEVQLQAGVMKFKAHISQLRLIKVKEPPKPKATVSTHTDVLTRSVATECDVRGLTLDEALMKVDEFLDQCMMQGLGEVYIIHGKGTGVLRAGIQQELRHHPHVKSFRLGNYGEGESGVSVVTLK